MVHMLLRRPLVGGALFVYAGFSEWSLNRFVWLHSASFRLRL